MNRSPKNFKSDVPTLKPAALKFNRPFAKPIKKPGEFKSNPIEEHSDENVENTPKASAKR